MNLLKKIKSFFNTERPEPDYASIILFPALISEKQFRAFEPESRIRAVMLTGDSGDLKYFRFMKWCILNDPDHDVRLTAMKRIPNFNKRPELDEFLLQLDKRVDKIDLEPYLSFALQKTGLITFDELQARLNAGE